MEKISNWFRHHYHHQKDDRDGVNEVIRSMIDMSADRPRKKTELAMYSEIYYESKLKAKFNEIWVGCLESGVATKQRVSWMKKYTTECWLKEPAELREEIRAKCDNKYAEELQAWKGRAEWSASPEVYQA